MRIISKFHDYYDHVQAYGMSDTVYERKEVEMEISKEITEAIKDGRFRSEYSNKKKKESYTIRGCLVGVGGTIFPAIKITVSRSNVYPSKHIFVYTIDELANVLHGSQKQVGYWVERNNNRYVNSVDDLKHFKNFFEHDWSKLTEIFYTYNVPVFVIQIASRSDGHEWTLNASLKDVEFYKKHDTYKTFQNIEMFVSGVLKTPVKPMVEISDTDMRDKKGFDKWSFKKMPTKKR